MAVLNGKWNGMVLVKFRSIQVWKHSNFHVLEFLGLFFKRSSSQPAECFLNIQVWKIEFKLNSMRQYDFTFTHTIVKNICARREHCWHVLDEYENKDRTEHLNRVTQRNKTGHFPWPTRMFFPSRDKSCFRMASMSYKRSFESGYTREHARITPCRWIPWT